MMLLTNGGGLCNSFGCFWRLLSILSDEQRSSLWITCDLLHVPTINLGCGDVQPDNTFLLLIKEFRNLPSGIPQTKMTDRSFNYPFFTPDGPLYTIQPYTNTSAANLFDQRIKTTVLLNLPEVM